MKKFTLYWLGGKCEKVEGSSIADACNRAGYGAGAIRALDFYDETHTQRYTYDLNNKKWVLIQQNSKLSFFAHTKHYGLRQTVQSDIRIKNMDKKQRTAERKSTINFRKRSERKADKYKDWKKG